MEMKLVTDRETVDRDKMYAVTNGLDELCTDIDAFTCSVFALARSDLFEAIEKGVLWNISEQVSALNGRLHTLNMKLTDARGGSCWPEPTVGSVGTD